MCSNKRKANESTCGEWITAGRLIGSKALQWGAWSSVKFGIFSGPQESLPLSGVCVCVLSGVIILFMALKDAIVLEWIGFKKGKHIHVFSFIPFSNNMCLHPLLLHVFCLCICIAFESAPGLILGRIFSSLGDPDGG